MALILNRYTAELVATSTQLNVRRVHRRILQLATYIATGLHYLHKAD